MRKKALASQFPESQQQRVIFLGLFCLLQDLIPMGMEKTNETFSDKLIDWT